MAALLPSLGPGLPFCSVLHVSHRVLVNACEVCELRHHELCTPGTSRRKCFLSGYLTVPMARMCVGLLTHESACLYVPVSSQTQTCR